MDQSIARDGFRSTAAVESIEDQVEGALDWLRPRLLDLARAMQGDQLTPGVFWDWELKLVVLLRDFGRMLVELLLNRREGDGGLLPHDVLYEGQEYRRLGKKTRNAHVATLFGTIRLWRFGYRFWDPLIKESCIFPLQLGLIEGATPALADYIGRRMAEAGATQNRVLQQLKEEHGVSMGVKRLRKLVSTLSEGLSEHRQAAHVEELLKTLQMADSSRGNRKPVLAVGRDGITLCEYQYRFFEVATTATVTVFDRAGKRLRTIFLAFRPELGQSTMSQTLTGLLNEVLVKWDGPLPTLAYVADSGGTESSYFEDTLCKMRHPRSGVCLTWQRVVDFYHAAERIWTMAKEGSTVGGLMDTIGILTSLALQYGVPVDARAHKFEHVRFEPSGQTRDPQIGEASSIIDYIFRWLGMRFGEMYRQEDATMSLDATLSQDSASDVSTGPESELSA